MFFAEIFGHPMTVGEHVAEAETHCPAQQHVNEQAARQLTCNAVCHLCLGPGSLKFMPAKPRCERSVDLFVHEQPVLFIGCVKRDPTKDTNAEFYARAGLEAARSADHPHRRERRRQKCEGVLPLMELEDGVYWRIDKDTLHKRRHRCHAVRNEKNVTRKGSALRLIKRIQRSNGI